jgi:hypothetical protein
MPWASEQTFVSAYSFQKSAHKNDDRPTNQPTLLIIQMKGSFSYTDYTAMNEMKDDHEW